MTWKNRKRVCQQCGKDYLGGKYSKMCDECRKAKQARCAAEAAKNIKRAREDDKEEFNLLLNAYIRNNKEKMPEYEICPNHNEFSTACISCPVEAWKFKSCGRKKC